MEKLAEIASHEENIRFAKFNLMQSYFDSNDFEKALKLTEDVLNTENLESSVFWDANLIKARTFLMLYDSIKAAESYKILEKAPIGEIVAEALYYRAFVLNKEKKYLASNKLISKIASNSSQKSIWNVKSLILLAKNYYLLNDAFQAIFVLDSVIENFNSYPKIIEEAKKLKKNYKNSLSDENRSVVNDEING